MASNSTRILAGVLYLIAVFMGAIVGCAAGIFVNANLPIVYRSQAQFEVTSKPVLGNDVSDETIERVVTLLEKPQDELISSPDNIEGCLTRNNLFVLDVFVNMSKDKCVDLVRNNLRVTRIPNSGIYEAEISTANPQDSATLLNNLIRDHYITNFGDDPEIKRQINFTNLEVARVGEQVSPILPVNLGVGLCVGVLLVTAIWFLVNPFRFKPTPLTFGKLILAGLVVLIFVSVGVLLVGLLEGPVEYASTAKIRIQDNAPKQEAIDSELKKRLASLATGAHEETIRSYAIIERTLEQNNLWELDSFVDYAKEEAIESVQDKIVASFDQPSQTLTVSLRCENQADCKTILNQLLKSYSDYLARLVTENKPVRNETDNNSDEATQGEYVLLKDYQTEIVQPATEPTVAMRQPPSLIPHAALGVLTGLMGMVLCMAWRATSDRSVA